MTRYRVGFMYVTDRNDVTPIEAAEIDERMKSREWGKVFEVWSNADPETDSKKSDMLVNAKRLDAVVAYLKAESQRELAAVREADCRAVCWRCKAASPVTQFNDPSKLNHGSWYHGHYKCDADPIRRMTGGGE